MFFRKDDHRNKVSWPGRVAVLGCCLAAGGFFTAPAAANGFEESRPYQFRTDTDRSVRLNVERTRLEKRGDLGVGGAGGLGAFASQGGQPTANYTVINGDNNTVTQESDGDQSTNNTLDGGVNSED